MDHLLDKKAYVIIYFWLIKCHRGNIIEVMLEKARFLKKLFKNIQKKMVILPYGLLQVIISTKIHHMYTKCL
jgi:hypothetical protein